MNPMSFCAMAIDPITLRRPGPGDAALSEALVRELLGRTRGAGVALLGATVLLWKIVAPWVAGWGSWLFAALVAVTVVRTAGTLWVERRWRGALPYRAVFGWFLGAGALIGALLGAIVLATFTRLPATSVQMASIIYVGIDFGAMVSLAASPLVFAIYVLPNVGALMAAAFLGPTRDPVYQAMQVVFALSLMVMSRSVQRSLRGNLELRLQLADSLAELQDTQAKLVEASRQAGRADVASAVIHNVGNVLNSVNVSAQLVIDAVAGWKTAGLARVVALVGGHQDELAAFLTRDARGPTVVAYLRQVVAAMEDDKRTVTGELQALARNIEHIRAIVRSQAAQVRATDVAEPCEVTALLDDAIRFSVDAGALEVVRAFEPLAPVVVDRHKALQIVMNLLTNARDAVAANPPGARRIEVSARRDGGELEIAVADNGAGISAAQLDRIFTLGFTTKPRGQGLGLHYSACAARELGGSLTASSDGVGRGATFRLRLPVGTVAAAVAARGSRVTGAQPAAPG
jgi:signal transduction histidine kinase